MDALDAAMDAEYERKTWRLYMAQVGEALASSMGYEVTPYAKIIGLTKEDTRTGAEIAADVLQGLFDVAGKEENDGRIFVDGEAGA